MANIKIAQLTNATTISDTDIVLIEDATQTKKITVGNLRSLLGIYDGGIVGSGANPNGFFTKYADGTLECYQVIDTTTGTLSQIGTSGIWQWFNTGQYLFAAPFVGTPYVDIKVNLGEYLSYGPRGITTNYINPNLYFTANKSAVAVKIIIFARGRWK